MYKRRYERDISKDDRRQSSLEHTTYKDYLRDLYIKILKFLATCTVYLDHNALVRTAREMATWDGWEDLSAEILDQETALLAVEARFDAFKVQEEWEKQQDWNKRNLAEDQALREEVHRIKELMDDGNRRKLLQWLTSINIDEKYNNEREKHREGTGTWLTNGERFAEWKTTANSVLWIHGQGTQCIFTFWSSCLTLYSSWSWEVELEVRDLFPASLHILTFASATAINALMTEFRMDEQTVVTYFYFDFRDSKKQNAKGMVRSLIYQICNRKPVIPQAVTGLWDRYRNNTAAQEPGLKEGLLPALKESLVGFTDIYIVLDGLDECSSDNYDLRTLLDTLTTIYHWSSDKLHIMLTSRFIVEIHERISPIIAVDGNIEIDLHHVKELNDDIRKFILAELSEHVSWPEAAKEEVATTLIEKAEGMYEISVVPLVLLSPFPTAA